MTFARFWLLANAGHPGGGLDGALESKAPRSNLIICVKVKKEAKENMLKNFLLINYAAARYQPIIGDFTLSFSDVKSTFSRARSGGTTRSHQYTGLYVQRRC